MSEAPSPFRFEEDEDYCVISLLPELNKAPWGEIDSLGTSLLERMKSRLEGNRRKAAFVVDLSELNYMGSAMVALVVRLWKAIKEKKARMVVVNSDENVLEVLRLSGLEKVWTIAESRESGLKALGVNPKPAAPAIQTETTVAGKEAGTSTSTVSATSATVTVPVAARGKVLFWVSATILLLSASGAGLYLAAINPALLKDVRISQALLFGGSVLGLIAATATASLGRGVSRTFGAISVIGFLALLVTGVYVHPQRDLLLGESQNPFSSGSGQNTSDTRQDGANRADAHQNESQQKNKNKKTPREEMSAGRTATTPPLPGRKTSQKPMKPSGAEPPVPAKKPARKPATATGAVLKNSRKPAEKAGEKTQTAPSSPANLSSKTRSNVKSAPRPSPHSGPQSKKNTPSNKQETTAKPRPVGKTSRPLPAHHAPNRPVASPPPPPQPVTPESDRSPEIGKVSPDNNKSPKSAKKNVSRKQAQSLKREDTTERLESLPAVSAPRPSGVNSPQARKTVP